MPIYHVRSCEKFWKIESSKDLPLILEEPFSFGWHYTEIYNISKKNNKCSRLKVWGDVVHSTSLNEYKRNEYLYL